MDLSKNDEMKDCTVEIENVKDTPFSVVKIDGKWRICIANNVISRHEFSEQANALKYARRMDSIDVITSVLLLINSKEN